MIKSFNELTPTISKLSTSLASFIFEFGIYTLLNLFFLAVKHIGNIPFV